MLAAEVANLKAPRAIVITSVHKTLPTTAFRLRLLSPTASLGSGERNGSARLTATVDMEKPHPADFPIITATYRPCLTDALHVRSKPPTPSFRWMATKIPPGEAVVNFYL